jgi:hypothetical protein
MSIGDIYAWSQIIGCLVCGPLGIIFIAAVKIYDMHKKKVNRG